MFVCGLFYNNANTSFCGGFWTLIDKQLWQMSPISHMQSTTNISDVTNAGKVSDESLKKTSEKVDFYGVYDDSNFTSLCFLLKCLFYTHSQGQHITLGIK